ncbi:hypothetical protein [Streptomyces sp. NPDC002520]
MSRTWRFLGVRAAAAMLAVPVVAVALGTPSAFGAAAHDGGTGAVITNVHTVATFDYAAGGQPENVSVNPDGSLTVSLLGFLTGQPPQLISISASGQRTVLVTACCPGTRHARASGGCPRAAPPSASARCRPASSSTG